MNDLIELGNSATPTVEQEQRDGIFVGTLLVNEMNPCKLDIW